MAEQVSIAQASEQLAALVNKVARGKKRIVLTSRGRPKAALVSLEDVAALEDLVDRAAGGESVFAEIDRLNRRILERRGGKPLTPSIDALYAIREERLNRLEGR